MKTKSIAAAFAGAAVAAAGAFTAFSAPVALAENEAGVTADLGSQAKLVNGDIIQGWTITGLKVSTDTIPHQVQGTLWEATATDEALQGNATPIVSNLNARARSGETYRALWGVATAAGVNPSTLSQGEKTTGKVYFDVTGDTPDSVVYATGASDVIVWVTPPPPASSSTGSGSVAASPRTQQTPATSTPETSAPETPAAESAADPAEAEATPTPAPTAAPAGSQGTPLPEGAVENAPVPAGSQGTALPEGAPALTPAGVAPAPAEGAVPVPAAVEELEIIEEVPVPGGSQGTPLPEGAAPTTTPVAPPAG